MKSNRNEKKKECQEFAVILHTLIFIKHLETFLKRLENDVLSYSTQTQTLFSFDVDSHSSNEQHSMLNVVTQYELVNVINKSYVMIWKYIVTYEAQKEDQFVTWFWNWTFISLKTYIILLLWCYIKR